MVISVLKMKKKTPKAPLWWALGKIYGIGFSTAKRICTKNGLTEILCGELSNKKAMKLSDFVNDNLITGLELGSFLKKKKDIQLNLNTYKGVRYRLNLPVNGQRTHSNASIGKKIRVKVLSDRKKKKDKVRRKRPQFFPKV